MKAEVSESKKICYPSLPQSSMAVPDSFDEDWKNALSGEEFVERVHEHIKDWWHANRENKKA